MFDESSIWETINQETEVSAGRFVRMRNNDILHYYKILGTAKIPGFTEIREIDINSLLFYDHTHNIANWVFIKKNYEILYEGFIDENDWPKTLDQAVIKLNQLLSQKEKHTLKESSIKTYNLSFGQHIRNQFGLWRGNEELMKNIGCLKNDPDEASMKILEEYHRVLNTVNQAPNFILVEKESEDTKIIKLYYLVSYRQHYSDLLNLESVINRQEKIISELFLYRQWFIQLLYRLFTTESIGEKVVQSILNNTDRLGKDILKNIDNVDIEAALGKSYMDLVNDRWTKFDNVFIVHKSSNRIPYKEILEELLIILELKNILNDGLFAEMFLMPDLLQLQEEIKILISEYHYNGKNIL